MYNPVSALLHDKGSTVHCIAREATVCEAVRKMNQHRIGALVVESGGNPIGMFTERDVLVRVIDAERDPKTTWVSEVMTQGLISIPSTTTVEEAMGIVTERRCRHLPVIESGKLLGMVSIGDLTRWIVRDHELYIDDLVSYINGHH